MTWEERKIPKQGDEITFLIGMDPFTESHSAKTTYLVNKSPVFKAMLQGPLAENQNQMIRIVDLDPRAFEILISFLSAGMVNFKSVPTALSVIYAAKKYMVKHLDHLALTYISKNINRHNVLLVLQQLHLLYHRGQDLCNEEIGTRVPHQENTLGDFNQRKYKTSIEIILRECFEIIDKNASKIIENDEFEDISIDLLKSIIGRDSLHLSGELKLWIAVDRWSTRQCRRRHLAPSTDNKRRVLEGAQYSVRFLTMSWDQFKAGQAATKLLTKNEEDSILLNMIHMEAVLVKEMLPYQAIMCTPRHRSKGVQKYFRRSRIQKSVVLNDKLTFGQHLFILVATILD